MTLPVAYPVPGYATQLGIRAVTSQVLEQELEDTLPVGMAYLVDDMGKFLVDGVGAFLYGSEV